MSTVSREAMRRREGNAYEIYLAHDLILTASADRLKQIELITDCGIRSAFTDDNTMDGHPMKSLIYAISTFATNIANASHKPPQGREIVSIKWYKQMRTDAVYFKYIEPWDDDFEYDPSLKTSKEFRDKDFDAEWAKLPALNRFLLRTSCLTSTGFNELQGSFEAWAKPIAQHIHRSISETIGAPSAKLAMTDTETGVKVKE